MVSGSHTLEKAYATSSTLLLLSYKDSQFEKAAFLGILSTSLALYFNQLINNKAYNLSLT